MCAHGCFIALNILFVRFRLLHSYFWHYNISIPLLPHDNYTSWDARFVPVHINDWFDSELYDTMQVANYSENDMVFIFIRFCATHI